MADGTRELEDAGLLDRAKDIGRVLFTEDADMLVEVSRRHKTGIAFSGLIYAHQLNVTIGECVADLEIIAQASDLEE